MDWNIENKKLKIKNFIFAISATTLCAASANNAAWAFEGDNYSLSVFGTVGYAISDKDFYYNRINQRGTFAVDSKLGVQLDYQFNQKFGATIQAKFARATDKDKRWRPELSWAFLSYRPSNDWLLRLGKLRIPSLLYVENMDVGMSYLPVRLPLEIYGTAAIYDFWGISSNKSFELSNGNSISWDAYVGYAQFKMRNWINDSVPGVIERGSVYSALRAKAVGTVVAWNSEDLQNSVQVGVHYASVRNRDPQVKWLKNPSKFTTPYGYYYNIDANLPGQGKKDINLLFVNFGLKWYLGNEFNFRAEAVHRRALGMKIGLNSNAFAMNISRQIGKFAPYMTFSVARTDSDVLSSVSDMNITQNGFPGYSERFNSINRVASDMLQPIDQYSLMLGTAYNISANQRLKFEYMRTHIGKYSSNTDSVDNKPVSNKNVNTFSMSYNFLF